MCALVCDMPKVQLLICLSDFRGGGGGVLSSSSVGRVRDSWWGGPGIDSRCRHPLPTGWVGVSIMWPAETELMVSRVWQQV